MSKKPKHQNELKKNRNFKQLYKSNFSSPDSLKNFFMIERCHKTMSILIYFSWKNSLGPGQNCWVLSVIITSWVLKDRQLFLLSIEGGLQIISKHYTTMGTPGHPSQFFSCRTFNSHPLCQVKNTLLWLLCIIMEI